MAPVRGYTLVYHPHTHVCTLEIKTRRSEESSVLCGV